MQPHRTCTVAAATLTLAILAGCAGTRPSPYAGLSSSPQLRPSIGDASGRVPYRYTADVDWRQYSAAVVDPVAVYDGPDHQFEEMPMADRQTLARYMDVHFRTALAERFSIVGTSMPRAIRVKATLTGAKANTRFLSTFSRFDLAGGPYNLVQAARGEEGALTGSVSYAVEVFDAPSGRLLKAYIAKQFPNAWNLQATLGALDASKAGIENAADDLVAQLR